MVVVAAVLVVGDDEQGLRPGRAVMKGLVDVVEELFADGQVRDRMLVILYLKVVVAGARPVRGPLRLDIRKAASWPLAASS